jgi:hypothetical protein
MKTNNHTPSQHRSLLALTGVLLVAGISCVMGASSRIALNASLVLQDNGALRYTQGKTTQTLGLHDAAYPLTTSEAEASRVLFLGMLLILSALFAYTLYVVRKQEKEERSVWHRVRTWFEEHLDNKIRRHPRFF